MKKYTILLLLPLFSMLFTSCLKEGLDEGILSTECDVTNVHFEHRWATEMSTPGMYQLNFIEMTVNRTIDTENCVIDVQITVPAVSATYPQEQRDATTLSNMACSFEVFHYIIGCIVGTEHFVHLHEAIVLATKGIEAVCLGLEIVEAFLEVTEHRLRYHDCAVGVAFTAVCHIALFHAKQRFYGNTPYEYFG